MNFVPVGDHVIVKEEEPPEGSKSRIVLPETAEAGSVMLGRVLSVGDGERLPDGTVVPLEVHEGDRVLVPRWAGEEIRLNGTRVRIVRARDILARVR